MSKVMEEGLKRWRAKRKAGLVMEIIPGNDGSSGHPVV